MPDDLGDINANFDKEDLEDLGESVEEIEEEQPEGEQAEAEEGEEEQAQEAEGEAEAEQEGEEEARVPQSRLNEVVAEREELKRKIELFERDPKTYRQIYGKQEPEEETTVPASPSVEQTLNLTFQDGPYVGKTLREVYEEDPAYASLAYTHHLQSQQQQQWKEQQKQTETQERVQTEINNFATARAKDLFDVESIETLTEEQDGALKSLISQVLDFQEKRGISEMEDAYKLMNYDKAISKAREDGAKGIVDAASRPGLRVVKSGTSVGSKASGYDAMLNWNEDQLEDHLAGMSDSEEQKFWAKAPESFKKKFSDAAAAWE